MIASSTSQGVQESHAKRSRRTLHQPELNGDRSGCASDRCKPATARCETSRLANLPKVAEEIERLRQPPVDPLQEAQRATIQALLEEAQYASRLQNRQSAIRMLGRMARLL
jgi:hypothetical protein